MRAEPDERRCGECSEEAHNAYNCQEEVRLMIYVSTSYSNQNDLLWLRRYRISC